MMEASGAGDALVDLAVGGDAKLSVGEAGGGAEEDEDAVGGAAARAAAIGGGGWGKRDKKASRAGLGRRASRGRSPSQGAAGAN